jgi:hypothetical protein
MEALYFRGKCQWLSADDGIVDGISQGNTGPVTGGAMSALVMSGSIGKQGCYSGVNMCAAPLDACHS